MLRRPTQMRSSEPVLRSNQREDRQSPWRNTLPLSPRHQTEEREREMMKLDELINARRPKGTIFKISPTSPLGPLLLIEFV